MAENTTTPFDPAGDKTEHCREHARNPEPGDYWHECFCPVALVISVSDKWVFYLQETKAVGDNRWMWDPDAKPVVKSRKEFDEWLQYRSIDGYWARCHPEHKKMLENI